jgi:D-lyxose ketol-isomerase
MKTAHKWSIGTISTLIAIIGSIYAFGVWSGVMWVTLDEFETFKAAQAQTDTSQTENLRRQQRRWDIEDYKFYVDKICNRGQTLTTLEQMDFDDILFRLEYEWHGC